MIANRKNQIAQPASRSAPVRSIVSETFTAPLGSRHCSGMCTGLLHARLPVACTPTRTQLGALMHSRLVGFLAFSLLTLAMPARAQDGAHLRAFDSRAQLERYLRRAAPPPPRNAVSASCSGSSSVKRSRASVDGAIIEGTVRGEAGTLEGAQVFLQGTGLGATTTA